jgi:competence protein ComEA
MGMLRSWFVLAILLQGAFMACTQQKQSPQELKQKAADATAQAKSDAKAVAEGIREGWNRNSSKALDLNSATKEQLLSLPGVTSAEADRVIAGRPYDDPGELVTRRIMPKAQYDTIADRVTAKR